MICVFCGTELPQEALFCGECGRPVAAKAVAEAAELGAAVNPRSPKASNARRPPTPSLGEDLVMPEAKPVAEHSEHDARVAAAISGLRQAIAHDDVSEPIEVSGPIAPVTPLPSAAPQTVSGESEACAQCGSILSPTDIFCGECGFVRRPGGTTSRPRDTLVLDPFPWGRAPEPVVELRPEPSASPEPAASQDREDSPEATPAATQPEGSPAPEPEAPQEPGPEPEPASTPASFDFDDEPDIEETRIVDRDARGDRFVLQFSTGESISVAGTGLVGRNPLAEPGEYFDALVTISDPGKSVSKTHLEFGQEGGAFWIADRFSGNGTIIREPERNARRCDAGKRYRISRGTRVDIGEQFFIVS